MIRKRVIKKVVPVEGQYLHNLFVVGKKGGNRPRINIKELDTSISYVHFKMVIHILKDFLLQRDLIVRNVRNRSKKCILLRTTLPKTKKICKIFVQQKHARVVVLVFWSWASTTGLYKTN